MFLTAHENDDRIHGPQNIATISHRRVHMLLSTEAIRAIPRCLIAKNPLVPVIDLARNSTGSTITSYLVAVALAQPLEREVA